MVPVHYESWNGLRSAQLLNFDLFLFVCCCLVTDPDTKQDDAVYDIITEDEVNGIYDSDSLSHTTTTSQEGESEARAPTDL